MITDYISTIDTQRRRQFFQRAITFGIDIIVVSEEYRLTEFRYGDHRVLLYKDRHPFVTRPTIFFTADKQLTATLLRYNNIRTPNAITIRTLDTVEQEFITAGLSYPVVMKPVAGRAGLGITVGIQNYVELQQATRAVEKYWTHARVAQADQRYRIEEMVEGNDYRALVLHGQLIACAQRVPAAVLGDGRSTIQECINRFNSQRQPQYWLVVDTEVLAALRLDGLTLDSILPAGKRVPVRQRANVSAGGVPIDVTNHMSYRFRQIAQAASAAVEGVFVGVDILTHDITSNDPEQPYAVIEVNSGPDYDLHEKPLAEGPGVDVTRLLLEAMMGTSFDTTDSA